jgi:ketosteroid isomerase-like protein
MSQENVEIAKSGVEAFSRRDVVAFVATMTEDYEWVGAFLGSVEGGSYRGRAGIERYFREAEETWEYLRAPAVEFRDLGDSVLVLGRIEGRGRSSGIEVETTYTMIVEFRGSKIWRSRAYLDHAEALRAAGFSE